MVSPDDAGQRNTERDHEKPEPNPRQRADDGEHHRQRPGDVATRERVRADRAVLDEVRRDAMHTVVAQACARFERPRRTCLHDGQRRKCAEFRRDDDGPEPVDECRVASPQQRRQPHRHDEKAAEIHDLEVGQ